jgi:hypothetical protein
MMYGPISRQRPCRRQTRRTRSARWTAFSSQYHPHLPPGPLPARESCGMCPRLTYAASLHVGGSHAVPVLVAQRARACGRDHRQRRGGVCGYAEDQGQPQVVGARARQGAPPAQVARSSPAHAPHMCPVSACPAAGRRSRSPLSMHHSASLRPPAQVTQVRWGPTAKHLVLAMEDGSLRLVELPRLDAALWRLESHASHATCMAFARDFRWAALCGLLQRKCAARPVQRTRESSWRACEQRTRRAGSPKRCLRARPCRRPHASGAQSACAWSPSSLRWACAALAVCVTAAPQLPGVGRLGRADQPVGHAGGHVHSHLLPARPGAPAAAAPMTSPFALQPGLLPSPP